MIIGALNSFLGATQAGESMAHEFFVIFLHNAFVRVDTHLWQVTRCFYTGMYDTLVPVLQ